MSKAQGLIEDSFWNPGDFHGVKGLIRLANGKYLFFRRDDTEGLPYKNCIDPLGGGREGNESPFETFARELEEEAQITIERDMVRYAKSYNSLSDSNTISWFAVVETQLNFDEIQWGEEGQYCLEMTLDEFITDETAVPAHVERTKDYLHTAKC